MATDFVEKFIRFLKGESRSPKIIDSYVAEFVINCPECRLYYFNGFKGFGALNII